MEPDKDTTTEDELEAQGAPASAEAGEDTELEHEAQLEAELAEYKDRYLRLLAEFENFKKRSAREYGELMQTANDRIIIQTLEVVDNFERALDMTEEQMKERDGDKDKLFTALHAGAQMIHQQLTDLLKQHGVEEIPAAGELFNPEVHEAVLQLETDEHPEDRVVQVITKGYRKGERVLRHARVGVSKSSDS